MAIDPDSGAIKGHFQYHWNDSWDWDEMNAPMVVDYEKDGQTVKGLIKPSRNGYLYWLERSPEGPIGYVNATNYVKQDVFASIDAKTGRPTYNDDHKPGTGKYAEFCPSLWGGKDWPYEAYNPNTGMVYIPANDNHCGSLEGKVQEFVAGQWWTGVAIPDIGFTVDKNAKSYGEIQAWNVNTGEQEWTHLYPVMNWGSILTTGGGLVFNGGTNDRMFRAFDARTGEQLWQFKTNSGIMAPPSSFEVDGVQYIAVQSGWGVDPAFQQGLINDILGTDLVVPQGGVDLGVRARASSAMRCAGRRPPSPASHVCHLESSLLQPSKGRLKCFSVCAVERFRLRCREVQRFCPCTVELIALNFWCG